VKQQNTSPTDKQDELAESAAQAGEHPDASDAIRDAQRALKQRRQEDAIKLERLRSHIQAGIDDLVSGDFVEIAGTDLDSYIEGLGGVDGSGSG
jgi:Arc/MetJ-type ribon-helix-helix transcriptional regulator